MGLTVQPDGKVLKIIESNRAREASIPVIGAGELVPREERYVTRLMQAQVHHHGGGGAGVKPAEGPRR
jgi:hypothetical protein